MSGISRRVSDTSITAHLAESANKHIKESGSNANGSYIKFDDGTMICYHELNTGVGNTANGVIWFSPLMSWTFPATFILRPEFYATPKVIINGGANPLCVSRVASGVHSSTSIGNLHVAYQASSATVNTRISIMAIGRWK